MRLGVLNNQQRCDNTANEKRKNILVKDREWEANTMGFLFFFVNFIQEFELAKRRSSYE